MERFLNIIHYKLFVWYRYIDRITNYINPIWWIVSIPIVKRFYAKYNTPTKLDHYLS